jgi:hypothetical protein
MRSVHSVSTLFSNSFDFGVLIVALVPVPPVNLRFTQCTYSNPTLCLCEPH